MSTQTTTPKARAAIEGIGRCDFKQYEHCGPHERIPDTGQRFPPFGCKNWRGEITTPEPTQTYDYKTTDEARKAIEGIVTDMSTKEGQREAEQLLRIARIEDRDAEPDENDRLLCRTCRGKGIYAGLDTTCRSCNGTGIERDTPPGKVRCQVCGYRFTPLDEPLCPSCAVYVPEAFQMIVGRVNQDSGNSPTLESLTAERKRLDTEIHALFEKRSRVDDQIEKLELRGQEEMRERL